MGIPKLLGASATPEHRVVWCFMQTGCPPTSRLTRSGFLGRRRSAGELAVAGFARKQRIRPEDLVLDGTGDKAQYYAVKPIGGRKSINLLSEELPNLILRITFPKTMYWTGKNGPRFVRPIRWIVAMLGDDVVPFEIAGVKSANITSGHRILGAPEIAVTIDNYEQKLRENFVILSAKERERRVRDGVWRSPRRGPAEHARQPH